MRTILEQRPDKTAVTNHGPAADSTMGARLWCQKALPDGTQGHWFFAAQSAPFICRDPTCGCQGHIVYQCPLHRSFAICIDLPSAPAS